MAQAKGKTEIELTAWYRLPDDEKKRLQDHAKNVVDRDLAWNMSLPLNIYRNKLVVGQAPPVKK